MGREYGQLLQGNLSTLLTNILKTGVSLTGSCTGVSLRVWTVTSGKPQYTAH